jgi:hypothetical protein
MPPDSAWGKSCSCLEAESAEPGRDDLGAVVLVDLVELEAELDILEGGAPRHQAVVLEHDADAAPEPVELREGIVALHRHPPGVRAQQP